MRPERSPTERTGQEDRRSKFYEIPDNLHARIEAVIVRAFVEFGSYDLASDSLVLPDTDPQLVTRPMSRLEEEGFGQVVEDVRGREFGSQWCEGALTGSGRHMKWRHYGDSGVTAITVLAKTGDIAASEALTVGISAAAGIIVDAA